MFRRIELRTGSFLFSLLRSLSPNSHIHSFILKIIHSFPLPITTGLTHTNLLFSHAPMLTTIYLYINSYIHSHPPPCSLTCSLHSSARSLTPSYSHPLHVYSLSHHVTHVHSCAHSHLLSCSLTPTPMLTHINSTPHAYLHPLQYSLTSTPHPMLTYIHSSAHSHLHTPCLLTSSPVLTHINSTPHAYLHPL